MKKRDGFLHESQQATPFSAPYLSQMADCRFQKRLFSDIQIFSWEKVETVLEFQVKFVSLVYFFETLNSKSNVTRSPNVSSRWLTAGATTICSSLNSQTLSRDRRILRLGSVLLAKKSSHLRFLRSQSLESGQDDFLQELPSREALYHLSPSLAHRSTSR